MLPSRQLVDKKLPKRINSVSGRAPHKPGCVSLRLPLKTEKYEQCKTTVLPNSQTSGTAVGCFSTNTFHHYLRSINVNESTFGRFPHASALDTIVVSNLRHVRCPSPGEADLVHNICPLVFRRAREECGAAFLGLRCVHVQLHGCILIGSSLATQTIGGKTVLGWQRHLLFTDRIIPDIEESNGHYTRHKLWRGNEPKPSWRNGET